MKISRAHYDPLVRLELRCLLPVMRRTLGVGALVTVALLATGHFTAETATMFASALSLSFVLIAPVAMMRDKYDGTLEVVRALPVHPHTIATGKMTAAAITVVPAAILVAAAFAWAATEVGDTVVGPLVFLSLFGIAALGLTLLAWLLLAALARYEADQLSYVPILSFLALIFILGPILERLLPDPAAALRWFVGQVWAPAGTIVALALFLLAAGYWSLRTLSRAIEVYSKRPGPEFLRAL